jgi:hypothetical protein
LADKETIIDHLIVIFGLIGLTIIFLFISLDINEYDLKIIMRGVSIFSFLLAIYMFFKTKEK